MSKKNRIGVVYSTNPDFQYQTDDDQPLQETLPLDRQRLTVRIDRSHRAGKQVTFVTGFVGTDDDLDALARLLKGRCGVGGSVKEGDILIQGDFRDRIVDVLKQEGYGKVTKGN